MWTQCNRSSRHDVNPGDTARERIALHIRCIGRHLRGIAREFRSMNAIIAILILSAVALWAGWYFITNHTPGPK